MKIEEAKQAIKSYQNGTAMFRLALDRNKMK